MVNCAQDRHVYVYNRTRETFVGTEVAIANNYLLRLIGLLGKTTRWAQPGRGLWIVPCRGVHTIGMMFPIDLVFLNKGKRVIHIEEHVRPFRISKVSLKATSVLELPAHTIYRTGTREGDCLEIAWLRKEDAGTLTTSTRAGAESNHGLCASSTLAADGGEERERGDRIA
jgi:uncharacterized protein